MTAYTLTCQNCDLGHGFDIPCEESQFESMLNLRQKNSIYFSMFSIVSSMRDENKSTLGAFATYARSLLGVGD